MPAEATSECLGYYPPLTGRNAANAAAAAAAAAAQPAAPTGPVDVQPNAGAPLLRNERARREWLEKELDMCNQVGIKCAPQDLSYEVC